MEHIMAWKQCSSATSLNIHWPINNFSQSLAWNCRIGGVMTLVSRSANRIKINIMIIWRIQWNGIRRNHISSDILPFRCSFASFFILKISTNLNYVFGFFFIIIIIIIMVRLFFERLCCWWCCFQFLSSESHCFAYRISNNI